MAEVIYQDIVDCARNFRKCFGENPTSITVHPEHFKILRRWGVDDESNYLFPVAKVFVIDDDFGEKFRELIHENVDSTSKGRIGLIEQMLPRTEFVPSPLARPLPSEIGPVILFEGETGCAPFDFLDTWNVRVLFHYFTKRYPRLSWV